MKALQLEEGDPDEKAQQALAKKMGFSYRSSLFGHLICHSQTISAQHMPSQSTLRWSTTRSQILIPNLI
jgi:hypothetical protein